MCNSWSIFFSVLLSSRYCCYVTKIVFLNVFFFAIISTTDVINSTPFSFAWLDRSDTDKCSSVPKVEHWEWGGKLKWNVSLVKFVRIFVIVLKESHSEYFGVKIEYWILLYFLNFLQCFILEFLVNWNCVLIMMSRFNFLLSKYLLICNKKHSFCHL